VRKLENNGGEMTSGKITASLSEKKRLAYPAARDSLVDDGTIEVQGIDNPANRAKDRAPAMKLILRNRATVQDTKPVGATVSNRPGPREWLARVLRLHCPSCGAQNQ